MKKTILFVLVIALFGIFAGGCSAPAADAGAPDKTKAPDATTK